MKAWWSGASLETAARAAGLSLAVFEVTSDRELEAAFPAMVQRGAGALLIGSGAFLTARDRALAALSLRHKLPAARHSPQLR